MLVRTIVRQVLVLNETETVLGRTNPNLNLLQLQNGVLTFAFHCLGHNPGELSGCHNDVLNMKEYIMKVHGFEESNITILMDDGNHTSPTRDNMLAAYKKVVAESVSGDAVFCHYSGHGGKLADDASDESTCCSVDIFSVFDYISRPIAGVSHSHALW